MAEKVSTKDAVERMSAATTEAANGMQHSYVVGLKGVQDYNKKWMEFAQANTQAAIEFYQIWGEVAFGVHRTFDHECTTAAYDADRADQGTWGACPAGNPRGC